MKQFNADRFWRNVDYVLEKKEMGLADLSRKMDDTSLYVSRKRVSVPSVNKIIGICNVLEIPSLDDLLFNDYEELEKEILQKEKEIEELKRRLGHVGE